LDQLQACAAARADVGDGWRRLHLVNGRH
jgi:hypothetical protein